MHERDVGERQIERRERLIQLGDEGKDVALVHRRVVRIRDSIGLPGAEQRALAPRQVRQVRHDHVDPPWYGLEEIAAADADAVAEAQAERVPARERHRLRVDVGRPDERLRRGLGDRERNGAGARADIDDDGRSVADVRKRMLDESEARRPRNHHAARLGHELEAAERDDAHAVAASASPRIRCCSSVSRSSDCPVRSAARSSDPR